MNANPQKTTQESFSADSGFLRKRLKSFVFAGRGLLIFFRTEVHAWVHLLATVTVVAVGLYFSVDATEWALLSLAIGLVWTAETVNTAIELTVDLVSPEYHELAGKAKDVAAASVLFAAFAAVAVAVCVFYPHLQAMIQ